MKTFHSSIFPYQFCVTMKWIIFLRFHPRISCLCFRTAMGSLKYVRYIKLNQLKIRCSLYRQVNIIGKLSIGWRMLPIKDSDMAQPIHCYVSWKWNISQNSYQEVSYIRTIQMLRLNPRWLPFPILVLPTIGIEGQQGFLKILSSRFTNDEWFNCRW